MPSCVGRHIWTQVDEGRKMLISSHDINHENEGVHRSGEGGGRARYVTPDLS